MASSPESYQVEREFAESMEDPFEAILDLRTIVADFKRQAKRWPKLHGNLVTQGALDTIIEQRDGNTKRVDELETWTSELDKLAKFYAQERDKFRDALRRFMPDLDQWNDLDARVQKSLDAHQAMCRRVDENVASNENLYRKAKEFKARVAELESHADDLENASALAYERDTGLRDRIAELEAKLKNEGPGVVHLLQRQSKRVAELESRHQVAPMAVACGLKPDATLDELYSRMGQLNSSWVRVAELRLRLEEIADDSRER